MGMTTRILSLIDTKTISYPLLSLWNPAFERVLSPSSLYFRKESTLYTHGTPTLVVQRI